MKKMRCRKKNNPPMPELQGFLPLPKVEHDSPCSIRTHSINRLISGPTYQCLHSLRASMLSGMALFLKTFETEASDHAFIWRMSAVGPGEIIRQGHIDCSASLRCVRIIWESNNFQQISGLELPHRFVL